MIIRAMQPEEIDITINLFQYYIQAAEIDGERYDQNRLIETVREYNIRPHLFFRVAFWGSRPVGLIGGFLSQDPVESELAATIQFCYLLDEHANIENYQSLVDCFEQWAKDCGCHVVRAIDIGNNITRLQSVYDDLAFDPVRLTVMTKEL